MSSLYRDVTTHAWRQSALGALVPVSEPTLPELRLVRALVEDAVALARRRRGTLPDLARAEARTWLGRHSTAPWTFEWCAALLDLDPDAVRRTLDRGPLGGQRLHAQTSHRTHVRVNKPRVRA